MNAPARVVDLDEGNEVMVGIEQLGVSAAEVNQQIATAKRYPRSIERFRKDLLSQVTLSEEIAGSCLYALPRAGKKIEGPSIRFAEIALGAWGNCRATARIVAETENFIVAQGIFIDLERNVAVGIEVSRRITDKDGNRFGIDMIGVTGAAASSIALRNAILRGIPRSLTDEAYNAAKKTVAGTLATLQDRRNRMLEAFKPYNVTEAQILASVGKQGLSEIGISELVTLGGYLTAIKSEEKDPEEIFGPVPTNVRKPAPPAAQQQSPPAAGAPQAPTDQAADGGEGADRDAPPADTTSRASDSSQLEQSISDALAKCQTGADIQGVASLFGGEIADVDAEAQERIEKLFDETRAGLFPGDRDR